MSATDVVANLRAILYYLNWF